MQTGRLEHSEIELALQRLRDEVFRGLRHGFFTLEVSCEVIKDRKRRLIIKNGLSYQHTIAEEDIPS